MLGYIGKYIYSIDEKNRVNLPSKFRKMTEDKTFVLSEGLEQCIFVFPYDRWKLYVKGFMSTTFGKKDDRDFFRQLGEKSEDVQIDDQGRIKIRDDFIGFADLQKEALIIGVMFHIEIWNPAVWESYKKELKKPYPELAEEALSKIDFSEFME